MGIIISGYIPGWASRVSGRYPKNREANRREHEHEPGCRV